MTGFDAVSPTGVRAALDVALAASPAELLVRQRRRLAERLGRLSVQGWQRPTRCPLWDVADVVTHLGDATSWALAAVTHVETGAAGHGPFQGFDPSRTPHEHVLAGRGRAPELLLSHLHEGTDTLANLLQAADQPLIPSVQWLGGQSYTPVLAGLHILWDSWLHELDLDAALTAEGIAPQEPCPMELEASAAYGIFFSAVLAQPWLDPEQELLLRVELGELGYDLRVGAAVRLSRAQGVPTPEALVLRGPAVVMVEALAGRGDLAVVADGDARAVAFMGGIGARMRAPTDHASAN